MSPNPELHIKLIAAFICTGVISYIINSCISQWKYMNKTIELLKHKCDCLETRMIMNEEARVIEHSALTEMMDAGNDAMLLRINTLDTLLSTVNDDLHEKIHGLNASFTQLETFANKLRLCITECNNKLCNITPHVESIITTEVNKLNVTLHNNIEESKNIMNARINGLHNEINQCCNKMQTTPIYIGLISPDAYHNLPSALPITVNDVELCEILHKGEYVYHANYYDSVTLYFDNILKSNIHTLNFDKALPILPSDINMRDYNCSWSIIYGVRKAINLLYLANVDIFQRDKEDYRIELRLKNELNKYREFKQICGEHGIVVEFNKINELLQRYK